MSEGQGMPLGHLHNHYIFIKMAVAPLMVVWFTKPTASYMDASILV